MRERKKLRLAGYDYAKQGTYFVTVCVKDRPCVFGEIMDGKMRLNKAGEMIDKIWQGLPEKFLFMALDYYVVMPNHFHGIIQIRRGDSCNRPYDEGEHKVRPYGHMVDNRPDGTKDGSLGRVIQAFKSQTTHEYIAGVQSNGWMSFNKQLWQRGYYDHIIRDEADLNRVREYIVNNPSQWELDDENPANVQGPRVQGP